MKGFVEAVTLLRESDQFFTGTRGVYVPRAPGRLDLMGGNVDYTGGAVFESTIAEATWAAAQRCENQEVAFWNPQMKDEGWAERVTLNLGDFSDEDTVRRMATRDTRTVWTAYVLGAIYLLRTRYPEQVRTGVHIYIDSNVPLNKGVSSSAAVEVAVMKAAAAAYGIELRGVELAEACQWVENVIAGSACGIMDQAASVLGDEGCVLPMLCQPCITHEPVRLPDGLRCWAIDSGVRHAVTGVEYEAARAAAFVGYRLICAWEQLPVTHDTVSSIKRFTDPRWRGYLSNLTPSEFRSLYERRLPELLTGEEILAEAAEHPDPYTTIYPEVKYRVRDCVRYAVEENHRIQLFIDLARCASRMPAVSISRKMGELMYQSHWSYTETGLGCDATDLLVSLVRKHAGEDLLFGAKVTGGGAGGTVAVLGSAHGADAFEAVVAEYARQRSCTPYVFRGSSPGADRFGIHVIGENG
jgi:L-arabinokinase